MKLGISRKYINNEVADLVHGLNDWCREEMPLHILEEYFYFFGLLDQGFTTKGIAHFLKLHSCIKIDPKTKIATLNQENLCELHLRIRKILSKTRRTKETG